MAFSVISRSRSHRIKATVFYRMSGFGIVLQSIEHFILKLLITHFYTFPSWTRGKSWELDWFYFFVSSCSRLRNLLANGKFI